MLYILIWKLHAKCTCNTSTQNFKFQFQFDFFINWLPKTPDLLSEMNNWKWISTTWAPASQQYPLRPEWNSMVRYSSGSSAWLFCPVSCTLTLEVEGEGWSTSPLNSDSLDFSNFNLNSETFYEKNWMLKWPCWIEFVNFKVQWYQRGNNISRAKSKWSPCDESGSKNNVMWRLRGECAGQL